MKLYYVYILKCSDGSYYTGMTNNLERRVMEHQSGFDKSCYTFSRLPLQLVFNEVFQNPLDAIKFEKQLKGCSRIKKEALINKDYKRLVEYSKSRSHPSTSR